jgi:hypothetical protein
MFELLLAALTSTEAIELFAAGASLGAATYAAAKGGKG